MRHASGFTLALAVIFKISCRLEGDKGLAPLGFKVCCRSLLSYQVVTYTENLHRSHKL